MKEEPENLLDDQNLRQTRKKPLMRRTRRQKPTEKIEEDGRERKRTRQKAENKAKKRFGSTR